MVRSPGPAPCRGAGGTLGSVPGTRAGAAAGGRPALCRAVGARCRLGKGWWEGAGRPGSRGSRTRGGSWAAEGVGSRAGPLPQEGRGRVGVDAGSLRSVSRKADRALHVQLQQLFYFLFYLWGSVLSLIPATRNRWPRPQLHPAPGGVHLPSRTHRHTQTDRLTHTDRQTHTRTH